MMMDNVIMMRQWPTPPRAAIGALVVTEYDVAIGMEFDVYTVSRALNPAGHGFIKIKDSEGSVVLVSRNVPDEYVEQLIIAYREGVKKGTARGFSARCGTEAGQ